jgi:nicotinamide riboside kinase
MQDFNDYVNNCGQEKKGGDDLFNLVNALAGQFDGKSQNELMRAIYQEAKKGKERGTLTNADIDNFACTLAPFLDDKKRKMLDKVVNELKKI